MKKKTEERLLCHRCKKNPVRPAPQAIYCEACKVEMKREYGIKYREELKSSRLEMQKRKKESHKPPKHWGEITAHSPKPTKANAAALDKAQRAHDMALELRLCKEKGYAHGPVRKLSRDEIRRLSGQITPIDQVPNRHYVGNEPLAYIG